MADLEKELKESIAYFEQILSVLPDDRTALEFLCVACEQTGEKEKFLTYALTLADVILREKSAESAADLIKKLEVCDDHRAKAALLKLQVLVTPEPELKFEKPELRTTSATPAVAGRAEIALLRRLISDGVLTESLISTAFDQLENLPTNNGDFLISALSILEKENLPGAVDALAAVADAAHAPPIPVESFEIMPAFIRRLPEKLVKLRGVIPFAQLGDEWAVVVLNPLDDDLKQEVSQALGKCHFFIAPPSAVEKVLDRVFSEDEDGSAVPLPAPKLSPEPKPTPEPAPEPIPEPTPEPLPEPVPESTSEPPPVADAVPPKKKLLLRRPR